MLTKLLLTIILTVGVVEASANCPAGTVPTLDGAPIATVQTGNRIDIIGVTVWGECTPSRFD